MKTLPVIKKEVDLEALRSREALPGDAKLLIDEPIIITENGEIKIVYCGIGSAQPKLVEALKAIEYDKDFRSGGLPTNSRIFGNSPRITFRKDFCAATKLSYENPEAHHEICKGAKIVDELYKKHNPDLHQKHSALSLEKVKPEWRLEETGFTSGIINKNNQLRYHFDTGNFKDVWSAMLVFKHQIEGGKLMVPEYDICFELRDHTCLMFDGQGLLHGVTPIRKKTPDAYRYSIVYYSLRQMWNCLAPSDELIRIKKLKTQREFKRAGL